MSLRALAIVAMALITAAACSGPAETPAEDGAAGITLARIGTIGDYPEADGRLIVEVDAEGVLTVDGKVLGLGEYGDLLLARAEESRQVEPPNASDLSVVLRMDRSLPWAVAHWLIQDCADPDRRVWKIHFAAIPEGGGEEGTLGCYLPHDRGIARVPERVPERLNIAVRYSDAGEGSNPTALYEKVKTRLAGDPTVSVRVLVADDVPVGEALRVMDVLYRAGAHELTCVGTPPWRGPDAITKFVRGMPRRTTKPSIFLSDRLIGSDGEPAMSLPAVKRVEGRPAHLVLGLMAGDQEDVFADEPPPK
jgi:hypothetical protein